MISRNMDNIELRDFLNFLSLACKVNIKENSNDVGSSDIDLDELVSNALIIKLFECYHYSKSKNELESCVPKAKTIFKTTSITRSKSANNFRSDEPAPKLVCDVEPAGDENLTQIVQVLKSKLLALLNEGIFDSILSYLIPNNDVVPTNKSVQSVAEPKPPSNAKIKKKDKKKKNCETKCLPKNE